MKVVWIVGEPGLGKTTLVRALLANAPCLLNEKPKWSVAGGIAAAGHYKGQTFDGADTVPYNGVKEALAYWRERLSSKVQLTIFDGDRFSNESAVDFFRHLSVPVELRCIHLSSLTGQGAVRRAARGSDQNAAWVKGRTTKSLRFAQRFEGFLDVSADQPPDAVLVKVKEYLGLP